MDTIWILGDQLLADHPALSDDCRVVMVESRARAHKLPYNRKKLVLVFSAMRHYAEYLRGQGYEVDYRIAATFTEGLRAHIAAHQPRRIVTMAAADYPGRQYQQRLGEVVDVPVEVMPNTQFLVERHSPIPDPEPGKRYVMEYFYRDMRRHFDILIDEEGDPAGGQWNYDKMNRDPLPGDVHPPDAPAFPPDAITQQVMEEVAALEGLSGTVEGFGYGVTHQDAAAALGNFIAHRLDLFGPYEDAMTTRHDTLFHSVLSPYINLGLLTPMQMVEAAVRAYEQGRARINSVEGFVRQVLGWREFMYWQYWRQMPDLREKNDWNATRRLPDFFWDGDTQMNCLAHTIEQAREMGYTHHIERLMLVTNYCTLAGIEPQAVVAWFKALFVDAYDWVMQSNVVGMGLNADGGITATKPYISSANYINKMGDYCGPCHYDKDQRHGEGACPFNTLYWNFLLENEEKLRSNPRFGPAVYGLRHLDEEERAAVRAWAGQLLGA